MKLVVFGLSISSSWGNGHATLWRGLIRALGEAGHDVVFFEWDAPFSAPHRERVELPGCRLELYTTWESIRPRAERELDECDAAIVTSYCPDGVRAARLVLGSRAPRKLFYDLDTPVTLERLRRGESVEYLPPEGLAGFDLVLSFTGGLALDELRRRLGARAVAPLYGSVDPAVHRRAPPSEAFRCDVSYLGTYSSDRQQALEQLLFEAARGQRDRRFLVAGAMYPSGIGWPANVRKRDHLPPRQHAAFYCSSSLTLNLTRAAVARMGYCPSGRLFEAAACGTPVVTDEWEGLERFFQPGEEILVARSADDTRAALALPRAELQKIGQAARERTLDEHTAKVRARQLLALMERSALPTGKPRFATTVA